MSVSIDMHLTYITNISYTSASIDMPISMQQIKLNNTHAIQNVTINSGNNNHDTTHSHRVLSWTLHNLRSISQLKFCFHYS